MYSGFRKTGLLFLLVCSLFSCKKETDDYGPEVTFQTPYDNQYFNVFDNIHVTAHITDETKIASVTIALVNDNMIPVSGGMSVGVSSPAMDLDAYFPVTDIHLQTGRYHLLITASDGQNSSRTYQTINIGAVPQNLRKIMVTTSSGSNTALWAIDSTFSSITPFYTFSGDFIGSSVSNYNQQIFNCGNYTGDYTGLNYKTANPDFSVPASISAAPYFTAYYGKEQINYVARYDGYMKGYNNYGNPIYSAQATNDYYVRKMIMNNDRMVVEEKSKTSPARLITQYYSTGVAAEQTSIGQDVVAFCEKDDYNVFVFGNASGQGVIQLYDRLNNNLWNPYSYALASGTILSAVKINDDTYLIGHSNGTIYKYKYQTSTVVTYASGYTAIQLKYDELNNTIYVAEANKISRIDYPSVTFIDAMNIAGNVLDISLLYNR